MFFIDGENLAIRYGSILADGETQDHVEYEPNVFVWSRIANVTQHTRWEVLRRYYYTSIQGDVVRLEEIEERLKGLGVESPRVFKKHAGKRSKRVDISLATDMLTHAHRKNYDVAVLIAGDEDYVPLVDAVMGEGRRVLVWFFEKGLNPTLRRRADYFFDIGKFFFQSRKDLGIYGWI
jgi:uncharacterized LabA/DUF88 family protein